MPSRLLVERAREKGVPTAALLPLVQDAATRHFGPHLEVEVMVNDDVGRLELYAVFMVTADGGGPAELAVDRVRAAGLYADVGDELLFQIFFGTAEINEARAHDHSYERLIGFSSEGCGFGPVATRAVATLLGLQDDLVAPVVQRAMTLAIVQPDERTSDFALRRTALGSLVLKRGVTVGEGISLATIHQLLVEDVMDDDVTGLERRDLGLGVTLELEVRAIEPRALVTGLFDSDAVRRACDERGVDVEQVRAWLKAHDVHLDRRTAFRARVDRILAKPHSAALASLVSLVAPETDARFLPRTAYAAANR